MRRRQEEQAGGRWSTARLHSARPVGGMLIAMRASKRLRNSMNRTAVIRPSTTMNRSTPRGLTADTRLTRTAFPSPAPPVSGPAGRGARMACDRTPASSENLCPRREGRRETRSHPPRHLFGLGASDPVTATAARPTPDSTSRPLNQLPHHRSRPESSQRMFWHRKIHPRALCSVIGRQSAATATPRGRRCDTPASYKRAAHTSDGVSLFFNPAARIRMASSRSKASRVIPVII